jgi:ribonuclease HI
MIIYTDGSCRNNGTGGIGILWIKDDKIIQKYSNSYKHTTNNRMELGAIKLALISIKKKINSLKIYTDSEYSIGCITNPTWNPKKNKTLINSIKDLLAKTQQLVETPIEFIHVKGHNGDKYNEMVDKLAQNASKYG